MVHLLSVLAIVGLMMSVAGVTFVTLAQNLERILAALTGEPRLVSVTTAPARRHMRQVRRPQLERPALSAAA